MAEADAVAVAPLFAEAVCKYVVYAEELTAALRLVVSEVYNVEGLTVA